MRTLNENIIVVDVETTGLDPNRHALIQIGAVRLDPCSLEEVDSIDLWLRPWEGSEWDPRAEAVHGISRKEANEYPPFGEAIAMFHDWCCNSYRPHFAGWNVAFDIGFLAAADDHRETLMRFNPYHPIDIWTAWQGAYLAGAVEYKASSLRKWCVAFGVECGEHHDALEDCRLAAAALRRLAKGAGE